MATVLLILIILFKKTHSAVSHSPTGVCFVPTKLSSTEEELSQPLISPEQDGYNEIFNQFIDPMLKMIPTDLGIFNSSKEYVGKSTGSEKQRKISQYRKMRKRVAVYYVNQDFDFKNAVKNGIWSISFGQFIFKFLDPIPGIPDTVIFNGLLPAVGISHTSLKEWRVKYPNGKPESTETDNQNSEKSLKHHEESSEESSEDKRRLISGEQSDSNEHSHNTPIKITEESQYSYRQTITANGYDGNNLHFWVVNSDPVDGKAFAVGARTWGNKLFSDNWVDINKFCAKHGSGSSIEECGQCEEVASDMDVTGLRDYIVKSEYLKKAKYCTKIVLCKDGAFEFVFKHLRRKKIRDIQIMVADLTQEQPKFRILVYVKVGYGSSKNICPYPSIGLNFKCWDHHMKSSKDPYEGTYPWMPSKFFGSEDQKEYRVLPPQSDTQDEPYGFTCGDRTAKSRPRFQLRSSSWAVNKIGRESMKTCCIVDPPHISLDTENSIAYYWPETRDFTVHETENSETNAGGQIKDNVRKRNFIPESAVVGKAPIDKNWPNQQTRDSVVGYRMDHGMSKQEAYNKPVTKEEYQLIVKNEEAVKDLANPDEHKISNTNDTNSFSLTHFYFVCVSLLLIIISSLFVLYK